MKLPLLHNSNFIKEYGYFYPENDIDVAKLQINKILKEHSKNISSYWEKSKEVIDKFSPKNPDNINIYEKILNSLFL